MTATGLDLCSGTSCSGLGDHVHIDVWRSWWESLSDEERRELVERGRSERRSLLAVAVGWPAGKFGPWVETGDMREVFDAARRR